MHLYIFNVPPRKDGTNRCNYQIELQTFKMYKNYKVGVNCNNHYNQKKFT